MYIHWEHLSNIEQLAMHAVQGDELPDDYTATLVPHSFPCGALEEDIVYIRVAILRDGVEIGDVGLACQHNGWVVAGSGYKPL